MSAYRVIVRRSKPWGDRNLNWYWTCEHCGWLGVALGSQQSAQHEALRHLADHHCTCPWTPPDTWTTHYGAVEPGSTREWDPDCPIHPPERHASLEPLSGAQVVEQGRAVWERYRGQSDPLWEDDGSACTPCRDCPGCHAVKPTRAPEAGVESPDASEAVRSPHSTLQTLPSPSVRAHIEGEPA